MDRMGCSISRRKSRGERTGSPQTAVAFLNNAPLSLHHAYLIPSSIFITPAMEFRLGGFDLLTTKEDSTGVLWGLGGIAPGGMNERCAPEVRKSGWTALRELVTLHRVG